MSYRLDSCSCKNKESKYFILHMNEKNLRFDTALEQVAEAVYFNPSWVVQVKAEDGYKITINSNNCTKYLPDEPKEIDYHLEYLEYREFTQRAALRNASMTSYGFDDDLWYALYDKYMSSIERELEEYKNSKG